MAGIPGLHLMGFAHRGIHSTVCLPDDDALARVRAIYRRQGIEDHLSTYRIAADAIPTGPVDVLVSYNALPYVNDWRGYLKRVLTADARWFFVIVSNPVSYGTYLRRAQRKIGGEDVVELFDHEATRRSAIEPELEKHGRILSHDYLDCPWWPDFLLPARKNLAGDTLAKVKGLFGSKRADERRPPLRLRRRALSFLRRRGRVRGAHPLDACPPRLRPRSRAGRAVLRALARILRRAALGLGQRVQPMASSERVRLSGTRRDPRYRCRPRAVRLSDHAPGRAAPGLD